VCQLELSTDSAGKLGAESEGQGVETAEQTAAAQSFHPAPQSGRGVLRWVEVRARRTPELSRAGGLPLLLPELLVLVLQADGSIN
jgi:hypothetical protein